MTKKSESLNVRLTRLQQSRYERQQRMRRFIILGSILVGIVTLVLVAAAIVQVFIVEPQRAVVSVGDQTITAQQFQKRMRYDQSQLLNRFEQLMQQAAQLQSGDAGNQFLQQFYQQQAQQIIQQSSAEQIAVSTLNTVVDDLLIRHEATRRGITVSPEDVTKELETTFGLYRETLTPFPTYTPVTPETPIPTATSAITATSPATTTTSTAITEAAASTPTAVLPTATPRLQPTSVTEDDFRLLLQRTLDSYQPIGITEQDLRDLIASSLYRERLQEAFADETPKNAPHFKFDYVRFNTLDDAQRASDQLAGGQVDFATLISQTNAITQPAPIGNGSSMDWTSQQSVRNQFGQEVVDQLAVKAIGAPTPVITSTMGGFYILLPLGREERALSEGELQSEQQRTFSDWLNKAREDTTLIRRWIDPTTIIPQQVRTTANNFLAQYGSGALP